MCHARAAILRLRSAPLSVDTPVHAEQFLGLDGKGSITAPAAVRDSFHVRPNLICGQTSKRLLWVILDVLDAPKTLPVYLDNRTSTSIAGTSESCQDLHARCPSLDLDSQSRHCPDNVLAVVQHNQHLLLPQERPQITERIFGADLQPERGSDRIRHERRIA